MQTAYTYRDIPAHVHGWTAEGTVVEIDGVGLYLVRNTDAAKEKSEDESKEKEANNESIPPA